VDRAHVKNQPSSDAIFGPAYRALVQAVVFDLDGVLIDSEPLWDEVRRGLAMHAGRPWPDDASAALQGVGTADWSMYMAHEVGIPAAPETIADEVIAALAQRYAARLPLMPGALEAVERLAQRWPLGLASGSPRRLIDTIMAATPLGTLFQVAVASDEAGANKPAPDVYLEVVRRLDGDPSNTVAIEDSANGLRSAHAAGLRVVAVPQPAFPQPEDALALADVTLASLEDLTAELVQQLLAD
jgi:HAD superfamily hydrolase (TIGR01509 family)